VLILTAPDDEVHPLQALKAGARLCLEGNKRQRIGGDHQDCARRAALHRPALSAQLLVSTSLEKQPRISS
jgi:hypothetical protein